MYVLSLQIVAYDFGIKHNILRRLAAFNCKLTVVPANYPAAKVLEMNPDGIFLSNGPVRAYVKVFSGFQGCTVFRLCPAPLESGCLQR